MFRDDDRDYLDWRERHEETGDVLALPRKPGERPALLHRARCRRTMPPDGPATRNPKACGTGLAELAAWARAEGWTLATDPCHDCGARAGAIRGGGSRRRR